MTDLHQEAARIIKTFNLKEGFIKNLVYSSSYRNLRQLFALVSESIKHQSILKDILKRIDSSFLGEELVNNDIELAVVLLYEELVGSGFGRAGFVRKMMRKHKAEIKAAHNALLKENNATSLTDILNGNLVERKVHKSSVRSGAKTSPSSSLPAYLHTALYGDFPVLPRYARVNLIKSTVQDAIEQLRGDSWEYVGKLQVDKFKEGVSSLSEYQFGSDPLLEDVLVFPIGTDLHKDRLVVEGVLVLQERASCVPAHVLNPPPGSVVLDCCAAPGNKTSHLAALMGDQGHVIGIDRDAKRVATMNSLLQKTGATCVETIAQDFLTLSPESQEVSKITMILLDPSCSCTGMPTGTSYRQEVPMQRLQSLKRYQISLLKHALRFPSVQRVVYSTCSTSRQENEEVVEEVMCHVRHCFHFVPVLPEWPNSRGFKKFLHHTSFLRVSPEDHLTAGFFVACFERIKKPVKSDCENSKSGDSVAEMDESDCLDTESRIGNSEKKGCVESILNEESDSQGSKKKKRRKQQVENKNDKFSEDSDVQVKKKRKKEMNHDSGSEDADVQVKKKKKRKKEKDSDNEIWSEDANVQVEKKKKRKKEKDSENGHIKIDFEQMDGNLIDNAEDSSDNVGKKRKKRGEIEEAENMNGKKKKRRKSNEHQDVFIEENVSSKCSTLKKKKKHEEKDESSGEIFEIQSHENSNSKNRKKKKEKRCKELDNNSDNENHVVGDSEKVHKKKKKKKKE